MDIIERVKADLLDHVRSACDGEELTTVELVAVAIHPAQLAARRLLEPVTRGAPVCVAPTADLRCRVTFPSDDGRRELVTCAPVDEATADRFLADVREAAHP